MKNILGFIAVAMCLLFIGTDALAQVTGDYRSRKTGNWNDGATWDRFDGTNWLPQAAFPDAITTASSAKTATSGTTHTVTLPAGIVSGDLLLIFWSDADDVSTAPTTPSGWTQLYTSTSGNRVRRTWYKVANGTEGTSINITAGAERSAHNSYRIAAGTYQGTPVAATAATGNSTSPNPPNLSPGFGTTNILWIAAAHSTGETNAITNPASYGNQVSGSTGGTGDGHARMITARRELNASSEDPASFTNYDASREWAANTVAIRSVAVTGPPTSSDNLITVRNPDSVTVTANVSVDQVVVQAGAAVRVNTGVTWTIANGAGTDLDVSGSIHRVGTITVNAGATVAFGSGSTYRHALNGGTVITASWDDASTCMISGMTSTYPSGMTQTFGNVSFNNALTSDTDFGADLTCNGNLTMSNTGSILRMTNSATNRSISVGGNFTITSGTFVGVSSTGTATIDVTGNYSQTGGTLTLKEDAGAAALNITGNFSKTGGTFNQRTTSTTSTSTVTVGGNYSHTSGTYDMSAVGAVGTLNVAGNFSHTAGTLTESSSGSGSVIFNGSGEQTYTSGGTISNTINFTVNSGSTLQMAAAGTTVSGGGTFTLSSGATLGIRSANGITTVGTASGNIQTTGGRSYSTGANYIYNGAAQSVGTGLPATVNNLTFAGSGTKTLAATTTTIDGNLSIEGTASVTAAIGFTINGNFTIGSGTTFNAGNFTHSLKGNWSNSGTFNANTSTFALNGTSAQTMSGSTFNNLTINNAAGVTMLTDQTVNGTLTLTDGAFSIGANTLTINGDVSTTSGSLNGGATSNITVGGSGASTTLPAVSLNNFTLNRANGLLLGGNLSIAGTLTLTNGVLNTGANTISVTNDVPGAVDIPSTSGSITGTIQRAIAAGNTGTYKFTNTNTLLVPASGQSAVDFTVSSFPDTYPPAAPTGSAINRYYALSPSAAFTADEVRLEYLSAENINNIPKPRIALFRRDATLSAWINMGGNHAVGSDLYATLLGGNNEWSDWALGDGTNPLPIQLASFTGTLVQNNRVRLDWRTISEVNNYGFFVQKRIVGTSLWTEIENSFVPGHGTTNEPQVYTYTDNQSITTSMQYRLKQVDLDATVHYTDPIQVDLPTSVPEVAPREFALKQNYPNPFNPSTEIKFAVENTDHAKLDVYNSLGQKVATLFDGVAEAGQYYKVRFNATGLSSGVYFYRLESGKKSDLKKLMLLK